MSLTSSESQELLVEQIDHVALITLNRPERLNAISGPMLNALSKTMTEANRDPDIRCVVLTGAGRGFCSGLDLVAVGEGGIGSSSSERGRNRPQQLFDLRDAPINVMWSMDTPIVCAVNGAAAGYGMDLTLLADIRIASENAKFAAVQAKRNVVPESGGTWLLPRLIGWGKAAELYYRARVVDAEEAAAMGLVNEVVSSESLLETALQWASEIADNAPMAVQTTKRMMRMGLEESYDTAVDHLMVHLKGLFDSDDFKEGISAFIEKRKPKFTGR